MNDLDLRIEQAESLWQQGDRQLDVGEGAAAYHLYTRAHDLIMDCPRLHQRAHRQLRNVSRAHGHRGEIIVDNVLLWLAPLGVFEAIAWAQRSRVAASIVCRRKAMHGI